jgi:hypothetical protein
MRTFKIIIKITALLLIISGACQKQPFFVLFYSDAANTCVTFARTEQGGHYIGYRVVEHQPEISEKPVSDYNDIWVLAAAKVGGVAANTKMVADFFDENIKINVNTLSSAKNLNVKKLISVLSTCIYPDEKHVSYPLTENQFGEGCCSFLASHSGSQVAAAPPCRPFNCFASQHCSIATHPSPRPF